MENQIIDQLQASAANIQLIDKDFGTFSLHNPGKDELRSKFTIRNDLVIFGFPMNGRIELIYGRSQSSHTLLGENYIMAADPRSEWDLEIVMEPNAEFKGIILSLSRLHELIDIDFEAHKDGLREVMSSFRSRNTITTKDFSAEVLIAVMRLFDNSADDIASRILRKSIVIEILSYFMRATGSYQLADNECPYLKDESDLEKIRAAEKILVKSIEDPPTIKILARQVGTNELKLKEGFKHVYGTTIFKYLQNHRMATAKYLLDNKRVQIKEVSGMVGYSNPSHFIAAFKSQFGTTPKQYLLSLK